MVKEGFSSEVGVTLADPSFQLRLEVPAALEPTSNRVNVLGKAFVVNQFLDESRHRRLQLGQLVIIQLQQIVYQCTLLLIECAFRWSVHDI